MALGAGTAQVCTAAMHYGFKIVEDMVDGLNNWMDQKGYRTLDEGERVEFEVTQGQKGPQADQVRPAAG